MKFAMLVGLPASGKSTLAKSATGIVHSSDSIREELYGDERVQKDATEVFRIMKERTFNTLLDGKDVVYDATNICRKKRMAFLLELDSFARKNNLEVFKECHIAYNTYEECIKNNNNRDRIVPEYVIKKMYTNWNTPSMYEGWNDIKIHTPISFKPKTIKDFLTEEICRFDQENSHHKDTLGKHMYNTSWQVINKYANRDLLKDSDLVVVAAKLHDIGKPFTKTFLNHLGEVDSDAHYYNHENVGAYDILQLRDGYSDSEIINISTLVNLHMMPYSWKYKKTYKKYQDMLGYDLYRQLMTLHDADVNSH